MDSSGNGEGGGGGWDDSIIMTVFNTAMSSHMNKRKGDKNSSNSSSRVDWNAIGEPRAWEPVHTSSTTANDNNIYQYNNTTNNITNNNTSTTTTPPIIDAALQEMLAAWYQSGYATGRYHAFKEMQEMQEQANSNNNSST